MSKMIVIDGSQGEGGGQILRTALALSLVTGQPFRLERIRAGRQKPGLLRQHLTAVEAAKGISGAEVTGAALGSQDLEFHPGTVTPGDYRFAVGTAGSATLVLQTVLPPLLTAAGPSWLTLEGGTHNPFAPPFDFLARSFAPVVQRMGPQIDLHLERPGFFPAGGGRFEARITPVERLAPIELLEVGTLRGRRARAILSQLRPQIGQRELAVVREQLGWAKEECVVEPVENPVGPGNALLLEIATETVTAVFTAFGERGRSAEEVGRMAAVSAKSWLAARVPVDEHLADQLLLPLALAGGGVFRTTQPSSHAITNAAIIGRFLPVDIGFVRDGDVAWKVTVDPRESARPDNPEKGPACC
jgi:RNA 3'-terminal phosphate cyclase (ATP)